MLAQVEDSFSSSAWYSVREGTSSLPDTLIPGMIDDGLTPRSLLTPADERETCPASDLGLARRMRGSESSPNSEDIRSLAGDYKYRYR